MSQTPSAPITFTDRAAEALSTVEMLIIPTGLDDTTCVDLARAAADTGTAAAGMTIVVYDRSNETWMDTPHASGPYRADELDTDEHGDGHDDLIARMREIASADMSVVAWLSTVPSLTEITAALQGTGADAVILPKDGADTSFIDKLTGRRDTSEDVAATIEHQLDQAITVFTLSDGRIDLLGRTTEIASRNGDDN